MAYIGRTPTGSILTSADIADGSISTAKLEDSAVTTDKITDNAVTAAKYVEYPAYRNLIINGDMSIAQRSAGPSGSFGGSGYSEGPDRWRHSLNSCGNWQTSQSIDVPSGQGFASSLKLDCTSAAASLAATAEFQMVQRMEGQMLQQLKKGTSNAESTTMSFWVKSNKTGTYIVRISDLDNSRSISKSYTINSASTWEKKTITFDGDTSGVLDNDNARSIDIMFWLAAGSNYTSGTLATSWESNTAANYAVGQVNVADSTSNEWYLTGVQWEVGISASDFEFLPYDVNLRRCQRYYYSLGGTNNTYKRVSTNITNPSNRNQTAGLHYLPVPMRNTPTVTIPSAGSFNGVVIGSANTFSSMTISNQSEASSDPDFSVLRVSGTLSSNSGNHCVQVEMTYASTNKMEVSAEL